MYMMFFNNVLLFPHCYLSTSDIFLRISSEIHPPTPEVASGQKHTDNLCPGRLSGELSSDPYKQ